MNWSTLFGSLRKTGGVAPDEALDAVATGVKTRRPVTVVLPHAPDDHRRSFFVGIDEKNKPGFYIDMLLPSPHPRMLTPGQTMVALRFLHKDSPHEMTAVYAGMEHFEGFPALKFHPPQNLTSRQRRKYYRVEPKGNEPVEILLQSGLNETSSALDISLGGVRFHASSMINEGDSFELKMKVPNKPVSILDAMAHVRSCVPVEGPRRANAPQPFVVRAEFGGIDKKSVYELNKYLFNRQREIGQILK